MTRVVIFFFNRGYLPIHMNYHDMITFRLRYTCVYFKSAPIRSVYQYGFFFFKSSLFDQRGIQEHSPGLLLPYVAVSSTCSHESFKVGLHREVRHELLFFFCLLTVWPPLCYMYIMFRSGQKVWRQKVRQRRDTNILSSYCLTIGIL